MPLNLANIKNDKRTLTITTMWGDCEVTYKPSALTPTVEDEMRAADDTRALIDTLCDMLLAWDVLDDEGEPLPITPAVLSAIPNALLGAIMQGCREDMIPKARNGRR